MGNTSKYFVTESTTFVKGNGSTGEIMRIISLYKQVLQKMKTV